MDSQRLPRIFMLTIFLFVIFLVFFYINEQQDDLTHPYVKKIRHAINPPPDVDDGENLLSLLSDKSDNVKQKIEENSPRLENIWTFECVNGSCKRKIADKNFPQISFRSCVHQCSRSITIWPKVMSEKIEMGRSSFSLANLKFSIQTPFEPVEELLNEAVKILIENLNQIAKGRDQNEGLLVIDMGVDGTDELTLTMDTDECYDLSISVDDGQISVKISAKSFFGARNALASLEQLIWFDDVEETFMIVKSATVKDCPKFKYRGLMLDTSRNYFSIDSIKRTLVGMSHVKLNRFHWHLTDSQSFPFVSKNYPELAKYGAYSSAEVYTHADVKEIVEFARVRGIQVIPEIDAPAHAGAGWQFGPEKGLGDLSLCINQQPWSDFCGEPPCGQLNPKNNNTYEVIGKLYEELLSLTGNKDYFHIGGDEVNFNCWKQFIKGDLGKVWCDFMLEALDRLKIANKGESIKHVTVWNSDWSKIRCLPAANFTIQVWLANSQQILQLINAKYNLIISHVDAWYFDCGFGTWRGTTGQGVCPPFKAWYKVYSYAPWRTMSLSEQQMTQIKGGEACMWTEQVDENSLDSRIWPRAIALAERLWSDPEPDVINSKETINRFSIFHTRFLQLGLKSDAIFPKYCEQNENECI